MSTHTWNLQNSVHRLVSGDFTVASNWIGGAPADGDSISLPVGTYTVSASLSGDHSYATLTQAKNANLSVSSNGNLTFNDIEITKGATFSVDLPDGDQLNATTINNAGTLSLAGETGLAVENDGQVVNNTGAIYTRLFIVKHFNNDGLVSVSSGLGYSQTLFHNEVHGTFRAGGYSYFGMTLKNDGTFDQQDGVTEIDGTVQNLTSGVLTGGTWQLEGTLLIDDGGPVTELKATTLIYNSPIADIDSPDTELEGTLVRIDQGATFGLHNLAGFYAVNSIDNYGILDLDGGTMAGSLNAHALSRITGNGVITGQSGYQDTGTLTLAGVLTAVNDAAHPSGNTITVAYDAVTLTGGLAGSGTVLFSHDTEVTIASSAKLGGAALDFDTTAIQMSGSRTISGSFGLSHSDLSLQSGARVVLAGTTSIVSGIVDGVGTLQLTGASSASGTSEIDVALRNDGTMTVRGHLTIDGAVTGGGHFVLGANATLELDKDTGRGPIVDFTGAHAALHVVYGTELSAVLDGFGAGDSIDLAGFEASGTTATFKASMGGGGVLTIGNSDQAAAMRFGDGVFQSSQFQISDDGHGGSTITLASAAMQGAHAAFLHADTDHTAMHYAIA